jgi:hypothetical protein
MIEKSENFGRTFRKKQEREKEFWIREEKQLNNFV